MDEQEQYSLHVIQITDANRAEYNGHVRLAIAQQLGRTTALNDAYGRLKGELTDDPLLTKSMALKILGQEINEAEEESRRIVLASFYAHGDNAMALLVVPSGAVDHEDLYQVLADTAYNTQLKRSDLIRIKVMTMGTGEDADLYVLHCSSADDAMLIKLKFDGQ